MSKHDRDFEAQDPTWKLEELFLLHRAEAALQEHMQSKILAALPTEVVHVTLDLGDWLCVKVRFQGKVLSAINIFGRGFTMENHGTCSLNDQGPIELFLCY